MKRLAAAAMLLALLSSPAIAARGRGTGIGHSWTNVVTVAPGGGYVLGNPRAKVRLIEYASLTCPHCAVFASTGWPALMPYVKSGQLALEVRSAIRDRFDLTASLLARCQGPQRYFDTVELIFAHQADWLTKASSWEQSAPDLSAMPVHDALDQLAIGAGLDSLLATRGYTPASITACLADKTAYDTVVGMANDAHITGTPAFAINDVAIDVHDWASLQPFIADAIK